MAHSDTDDSDEDPFDRFSADPTYRCSEPCCHRFGLYFKTRVLHHEHIESCGHVTAMNMRAILQQQRENFETMLELKILALRELRCDAEACPHYDFKFPSSRVYYAHLQTRTHVRHCRGKGKDTTSFRPSARGSKEMAAGQLTICTVNGCPGKGKDWRTKSSFGNHARAKAHRDAEAAMGCVTTCPETPRRVRKWNRFS